MQNTIHLRDDPQWYKDAIIYQLHVKAFFDSDNNGIGDFRGLVRKLNYLEELGCNAIWLLPFYPSPLKDDGYDIADYCSVHPNYGTVDDFRFFLNAAHERGIRVITELVLNHTSDQHRWFQEARRAPVGSSKRDFYVWSQSTERYRDTRIIFKDFESSNWTWDPVAQAYFWHRFYSHQPDLNFENPEVHEALFQVLDFWFEMGVDGMRLDAVPYLFEQEHTSCENLPQTHQFLKKLRSHVDRKHPNTMLLAEANQWPEDATPYFGQGDECHMAFHFPIMPRLFMSLWMEDRFPIIDILEQTPDIPDSCQWAIFLRNHDELTLEMVTDEERDYMYRMYARDPRARINLGIRRRLAPLLNNNRRKIELMHFLLFSLPGTPIIYYGDEIGMGDNYFLGDRNGVRTPMQWSPDRNAGFSKTNPQQLYLPVIMDPEYHYEVINVENQDRNPSSFLWWIRRVIGMRKRFEAFGRGETTFLFPDNPKVLAFTRTTRDETILVVINLSRFAQSVSLDLSRYAGHVPQELFSGNRFPRISTDPYLFTLGIHDYFWFQLLPQDTPASLPADKELPELEVNQTWDEIFNNSCLDVLEQTILPEYLTRSHWSRAVSKRLLQVSIRDRIPMSTDSNHHWLVLIHCWFAEGPPEQHVLCLSFQPEDSQDDSRRPPHAALARLKSRMSQGLLYDGLYDPSVQIGLLNHLRARHKLMGTRGTLRFTPSEPLVSLIREWDQPETSLVSEKKDNMLIHYPPKLCLKIYRTPDEGPNPGQEILQHLSQRAGLDFVPEFAGDVTYRPFGEEPMTLGIFRSYIQSQGEGDAWALTLDALHQFFENIRSRRQDLDPQTCLPRSIFRTQTETIPDALAECIGVFFLQLLQLLGRKVADFHLALARATDSGDLCPEPLTFFYQRSEYQSIRTLIKRCIHGLRKHYHAMPTESLFLVDSLLEEEHGFLNLAQQITQHRIEAQKTRIHGNLKLTNILFTGNSFAILNFEGDPTRPLSQRRLKRSPALDVAAVLGSCHYAAHTALTRVSNLQAEDIEELLPWVNVWHKAVSGVFLNAYLDAVKGSSFLPGKRSQLRILLTHFLLEKGFHEIYHSLDSRQHRIAPLIRGLQAVQSWR